MDRMTCQTWLLSLAVCFLRPEILAHWTGDGGHVSELKGGLVTLRVLENFSVIGCLTPLAGPTSP